LIHNKNPISQTGIQKQYRGASCAKKRLRVAVNKIYSPNVSNEETKMKFAAFLGFLFFGIFSQAFADTGSHYDWGIGNDRLGHCYEWTTDGRPLNRGQPVADSFCEISNPSIYDWGRKANGWGACFHVTPYGALLNRGLPVTDMHCEDTAPSYYSWAGGRDGFTRCYKFTAYGIPLNNGMPVGNNFCK
jgi:hypothetical protein